MESFLFQEETVLSSITALPQIIVRTFVVIGFKGVGKSTFIRNLCSSNGYDVVNEPTDKPKIHLAKENNNNIYYRFLEMRFVRENFYDEMMNICYEANIYEINGIICVLPLNMISMFDIIIETLWNHDNIILCISHLESMTSENIRNLLSKEFISQTIYINYDEILFCGAPDVNFKMNDTFYQQYLNLITPNLKSHFKSTKTILQQKITTTSIG